MRSVTISLALASLSAFVGLSSCTLITDVDRSKIPTDGSSNPSGGSGDMSAAGSGNSEAAGAGGVGQEVGGAPGEDDGGMGGMIDFGGADAGEAGHAGAAP